MHEVGEGREFWGVGEGGGHVHVDRGAVGSDETSGGFDAVEHGLFGGLFGCPAVRESGNGSEREEVESFCFLRYRLPVQQISQHSETSRSAVVRTAVGSMGQRE